MTIHFVCTGNVYRSRLAEAYLNSKQLSKIHVSSSGILAKIDYPTNGPIFWGAMRLLQKYNLIPFMSPMPQQTTLALLQGADRIIFMRGNHHQFSRDELGWIGENFEIWDIPDLDDLPGFEDLSAVNVIDQTEKTFTDIQEKVDVLVKKLQVAH